MQRRSLLTVAFAAAALAACSPSLSSHQTNPASTDYVLFDPTTSQIPLPNDLALQTAAEQPGAQGELLQAFVAQGGFPNDQEVPVTVDVQRFTYGGAAPQKGPPPVPVDTGTLLVNAPAGGHPPTVALFEKKSDGTVAPVDPTTLTTSYVQTSDRGTITFENKPHAVTLSPGNVIQSRRWNAGSQYIVLLAGGANGVKLQGGGALTAMPTMYILTRGVDLNQPQNQGILPGDSPAARAAAGAQLEAIRQSYVKAGLIGPGSLAEQVFGAGATQNLLSIQTFQIAPAKPGAAVVTDASAGVVPLPSDLLLDPATNKIVNNPAFGALASGLATLDGFSTTAMELTQTSAPVVASTVNANSVFLYDLSNPAQPVRLKEFMETAGSGGAGAGFVAEPYQMTQKLVGTPPTPAPCSAADSVNPAVACFSTAVGLQPAVPIPLQGPLAGAYAALPPLKEGTEYAVLITDGVKDTTGGALQGSTLSRILLFQNPLVDASGKSQVPGQSDATAAGLEKIRQGVAAAAKALVDEKGATSKVVLGYTFRTQSITQTSLQLAAYPYSSAAITAKFVPGTPADVTPTMRAAATAKGIPTTAVQAFWMVPFFTKNPIDPATGALNPDDSKWTDASLSALVVVPAAKQGAPLVVFQHGLGGDKTNVLAIANALAGAGFVAAAIDAPLHGDRSYCVADVECVCPGGGTACGPKCNLFPTGAQGDTVSGVCSTGSVPEGTSATPGQPISGRFFVSANLFRTRDALRESILDTSALVLALAPPSVPSNPFAAQLAAAGVTIDPTKVYWIGQSLGGILGTLNTAANPRISRAVLNVPGGTLTDVFSQSPTFQPLLAPILAAVPPPLGPIAAGTPQYLEFIQIAKLILDGGDPVNFAAHLTGDATHPTLQDLLASKPNQAAKSVLAQVANGDTVIPNPFNYELLGNVFSSPQPDTTKSTSNVSTYFSGGPSGTGPVPHSFLLDPTLVPAATVAAQSDAVKFLLDPTQLPPPVQHF